ncbi:MAG TPA: adenylate kinase [bacterium]|nr:adenylate kinase [bacterium]
MPTGNTRLVRSGKLVIVAGINGVGKTTVLNTMLKLLPPDLKVNVFNYGDVMLEIAKRNGWVAGRDDLRKLPLSKQLLLQEEAAEKLFDQARQGNVVVDTHALITTKNGFLPGLPKWVIETLQPDVIVLVEALPEEILKRRLNDTMRVRDDQSTVEEIRLFLELNRSAAISSAVFVGASVLIVRNVEGDATQAASKIVKLFTPDNA